jgi:predicted phage terminase large subunit-like protein
MAAAQYLHVPGYAALLLRRTYADLALPGALMDRAKEWWKSTSARWSDKEKTWYFPTGGKPATITFGYLENEDDKYRYGSSEVQMIGLDELSQFSETQYRFLSSRLRRLAGFPVPIRKRGATNPVGPGRVWVKKRFLSEPCLSMMRTDRAEFFRRPWYKQGEKESIFFIPAKKDDNPSLDIEAYRAALSALDQVTRAQLEEGDWDISEDALFKKKWFRYFSVRPAQPDYWFLEHFDEDGQPLIQKSVQINKCRFFITVDLATSLKTTADYTVIACWADDRQGNLLLVDLFRGKIEGPDILPRIRHMRQRWNAQFVGIESYGMQLSFVQSAKRQGLPVKELKGLPKEDKVGRATTAIIRMEQGQIWFPDGRTVPAHWLEEFEDELLHFDGDKDKHDDQVDVLSWAAMEMTKMYDRGPIVPPRVISEGAPIMNGYYPF